MIKPIILLLLLSFFGYAHAKCKLPPKSSLTIGCSTLCSKSYKNAIYNAANRLRYSVSIVNMYNQSQVIDLNSIDAFIVPGGVDIDPKYYKDKVEQDLRDHLNRLDYLVEYTDNGKIRDPFEYKLWQEYFNREDTKDLPALGICRGMQMLSVSQGIPLYIDIRTELGIPNRRDLKDKIIFSTTNSRMRSVLGWDNFWAYENHHQGPRVDYFKKNQSRWPHLTLSAYSNSGKIAEIIEAKNHLAMGVQFHPEQDRGQLRTKVFSWLLENACEKKLTKIKL